MSRALRLRFACALPLLLTGCGSREPAKVESGTPSQAPVAAPLSAPAEAVNADSSGLAAGCEIPVTLREAVDSEAQASAEYISGEIAEDVRGADGKEALPAGSHTLLVIRRAEREQNVSTLTLALYSVFIGDRQVKFSRGGADLATLTFSEDAGQGAQHHSVHLADDRILRFKLDAALPLK